MATGLPALEPKWMWSKSNSSGCWNESPALATMKWANNYGEDSNICQLSDNNNNYQINKRKIKTRTTHTKKWQSRTYGSVGLWSHNNISETSKNREPPVSTQQHFPPGLFGFTPTSKRSDFLFSIFAFVSKASAPTLFEIPSSASGKEERDSSASCW